jgi:hypothetical protein
MEVVVLRIAAIAVSLAALSNASAGQAGGPWQAAPEYLPLFAPAGPRGEPYRAFVSPLGLDAVLARLQAVPGRLLPPGAWEPKAQLPFDAFGQTGRYDRWKLAQVYGSRRALVARGPWGTNGQVTETWTLISPYPDPSLTRLESGTLLIVLRIP